MQADDGEKGINLAITAIPVSFLPNSGLPNIDLLAVLGYLQQDPQTANIPVEEVLSFLLNLSRRSLPIIVPNRDRQGPLI